MDNSIALSDLVIFFDKIINAYIGGGKTWDAEGKSIFAEAKRIKQILTGEPDEEVVVDIDRSTNK